MPIFRVPLATYRLQFNSRFGFRQARELVPYLHELGITDVYASPLFQARRGSTHGYDTTDPTRLNPELGTEEEFNAFVEELQRHGMGLLLDLVPNHMAASSENCWWMDVLEQGRASRYANFFDIDWSRGAAGVPDKVLLPILGDSLENVLRKGELKLKSHSGSFFLQYHDSRLPLALDSYVRLLGRVLERLEVDTDVPASLAAELREWTRSAEGFSRSADRNDPAAQNTSKVTSALKKRLRKLCLSHAGFKKALNETLEEFNRPVRSADGADPMRSLLAEQHYVPAHWRTGAAELNYRRFFDITDLVCLRACDPAVFDATHGLLLRLVTQGKITGVRVDHVDGLSDPSVYLRLLRKRLAGRRSYYVLVEKILTGDEVLPPNWQVSGTTGYEFMNRVNRLFADPRGMQVLDAFYAKFTRRRESFDDVAYAKKKQVMESLFPGEMRELADRLAALAVQLQRRTPTRKHELEVALREVTACLPVYRTYIQDGKVSPTDRRVIEQACRQARRRNLRLFPAELAFLRRILLLQASKRFRRKLRNLVREFIHRWQQSTGPIMAKGFEDTALYAHVRLVSLNEVGGDPRPPRKAVEELHNHLGEKRSHWPHTLNATTTHDTKRGEDVRARISVVSGMAPSWSRRVRRWAAWNRTKKTRVAGRDVPDSTDEYLIYQTLLGAWPDDDAEFPAFRQRLQAYAIKAAREAKRHTSWRDVNEAYEGALLRFVASILDSSRGNRFLADFRRFQQSVAHYGRLDGLSQLLLKIGAPGVPDFYQGTELWELRLVDPDNRGPVDFGIRAEFLRDLQRREQAEGSLHLAQQLLSCLTDGRAKLYISWKALCFRRYHPDLFLQGSYIPLAARGSGKQRVCAFLRRRRQQWALIAVPRLLVKLLGRERLPHGKKVWRDTRLLLPARAPERWVNCLTGEAVKAHDRAGKTILHLGEVFRNFPVALLAAE